MSGGIQGFSHMYTVNQDDVHPVVGPWESTHNFFQVGAWIFGPRLQVGACGRVVAHFA